MNKNIDPWWVVAVTTNKLVEITIMTRSIRKGKGSEGKGERGKELSRLDPKHQKYRLGHSAHFRVLL